MNGEGSFIWNTQGHHWAGSGRSYIALTDEGDFNGEVHFKASDSYSAYLLYAEFRHDKALQNAIINLNGGQEIGLGISTDDAHFKGVTSLNAISFVCAGDTGGGSLPE